MNWEMTLLFLPGLIVGITCHEFAHAWSASLLGDDYARRQGRVSLNPFRHLTPLGTFAILLLPIGWGKPVLVNLYNFKHPRRDYLLTSLAGPLANMILVGICLLLMQWTRHPYRYDGWLQSAMILAHVLLTMMVLINAVLATLNLLPVPPLDGSKIWPCLLPRVKAAFQPKTNQFFFVVFIILIFTKSLQPIMEYSIHGVMRYAPQSDVVPFYKSIADGNEALKDKRWVDAEGHYDAGLALNTHSEDCYYGRASARCGQWKWEPALQDIDRAIAIRPHSYYYQTRADILLALGRPEEAEKDRKKGEESAKPERI
jgi:Zn-dependent protease